MQRSGCYPLLHFTMKKPKQLIFDFKINRKAGLRHFYFQSEELKSLFNLENFSQLPQELLILGATGAGKSYLLQAYFNDATSIGMNIGYLPLKALLSANISSFEGYEDFELVLIDGIEMLSGSKELQTALFNFLNHAFSSDCHVILTSSTALPKLNFFADLYSRLTRMETHNLEVLLNDNLARALSVVSESYEISISEKEVDFLLKRYKRDIKSLMVALHSLDDLSASQKRKITVPLIREFLDS